MNAEKEMAKEILVKSEKKKNKYLVMMKIFIFEEKTYNIFQQCQFYVEITENT